MWPICCNFSVRVYCLIPQHIIIIIIIIIINIIIEFLTSELQLGNIHLSWDLVINRIRLGGLIYTTSSLESCLQLNMCRELQIFAFVYMYLNAGQVCLDFVIVTLELLPRWYFYRDHLCCVLLPHSAIFNSPVLDICFVCRLFWRDYMNYYFFIIIIINSCFAPCITTFI